MAVGLPERIKSLRETHAPRYSRRRLGEALGYVGRSAEQTVYEWETGRRQIPAADVPSLAEVLGVTICELYGVEEGHRLGTAEPMSRLAADLASALAVPAERIEIHVHRSGESNKRYEVRWPTTSGKTVVQPGYEASSALSDSVQNAIDAPEADFELGQSVESEEFTASTLDSQTRAALEMLAGMTGDQRDQALAFLGQLVRESGA